MPKPLVDAISLPPAGRACALPLSMAAHVALAGAILVAQALSPVELPATAPPPIVGIPTVAEPAPPPPPRGNPVRARIHGTTPLRAAQGRSEWTPAAETPRWAPFAGEPTLPGDAELGPGFECEGCSPDGEPDGVPGGSPGSGGPGLAPPKPVPVGGDIRPPTKLRHVNPVYPEIAKAAHVQGEVILECVIDVDGRVTDIRVVRGHPLLDSAAVAAVEQWLYEPTRLNGKAVAVVMNVTVGFRISR